jgi:hypothetical protein
MKWTHLVDRVDETEIDRFSPCGAGELMIIEVIWVACDRVRRIASARRY